MIKFIMCVMFNFVILSGKTFAAGPDLRVGITALYPPYIIQVSPTTLSGFDIDMMNYICNKINRTCKFERKTFDELIPALTTDQLDVAIGAIAITLERSEKVLFSNPYLPSSFQLITKKDKNLPPYSLAQLNDKNYSILQNSGFISELSKLGVKNPHFSQFSTRIDAVQALMNNKSMDFAVVDQPAALYWVSNSFNTLATYGPAVNYGTGLGIAVNPKQIQLAAQINEALAEFQKSGAFEQYYNMYIYAPPHAL